MKFLIPTDFSGNAETALNYALALATSLSAEIDLLHVIHPTTNNALLSGINAQELNEEREEAVNKFVNLISKAKTTYGNITINYYFGVGTVAEVVNQKANELKVDMVIIGTHGASGLKKFLLGSNASSVIETVDVPVLAIPDGAKFYPPKKILFATNYYVGDVNVLERLVIMAKQFGSEIEIVHVIDEDDFDEDENLYLENCTKLVKAVTHYDKISHKTYKDHDVKEGIKELVASENADILAVSSRKRSFLEKLINKSLAKDLSYDTFAPLLSYKISE